MYYIYIQWVLFTTQMQVNIALHFAGKECYHFYNGTGNNQKENTKKYHCTIFE